MTNRYTIRIIRRDGMGQINDDYHATIRRLDGEELIFISRWRWFLNWKIRRKALDRAFARCDIRQKKLAEVDRYVV